jgi:hypothetical protein
MFQYGSGFHRAWLQQTSRLRIIIRISPLSWLVQLCRQFRDELLTDGNRRNL